MLGLRIEGDVDASGIADPLSSRSPGAVMPLTGGDLAALLFIGLMVITIGGLIWRAPSLIDKPRRSHDISLLQ